jgi:hypothetical protein
MCVWWRLHHDACFVLSLAYFENRAGYFAFSIADSRLAAEEV